LFSQVGSRSHDAVIRVYDAAGNVIETHEHKSDFKDWLKSFLCRCAVLQSVEKT
jgi:hypothetical protein